MNTYIKDRIKGTVYLLGYFLVKIFLNKEFVDSLFKDKKEYKPCSKYEPNNTI